MSMDYEAQLKLQGFLDGELSEAETREVANWLAQDREAVALLGELRNTRQAMVGLEIGVALPESREFFWSKIQREIERTESAAVPEPTAASWMATLRRFLAPATALAVLGIALIVAFKPSGVFPMETALADPGAFTYHDYSAGATLVWLSYPAEDEEAPADEMGSVE
jgi:anti-sigma factor RsiW